MIAAAGRFEVNVLHRGRRVGHEAATGLNLVKTVSPRRRDPARGGSVSHRKHLGATAGSLCSPIGEC